MTSEKLRTEPASLEARLTWPVTGAMLARAGHHDGRRQPGGLTWPVTGAMLARTPAILGGVLAMLRLLELSIPAGGVDVAFLGTRPEREAADFARE